MAGANQGEGCSALNFKAGRGCPSALKRRKYWREAHYVKQYRNNGLVFKKNQTFFGQAACFRHEPKMA